MKTVSAECLLRGSLHALDHCSALLRDAVVLLRARRYSTAAALALLGREELGRHRILLGMWRAVATGGPDPTVEQVNNACGEDHVDKQREAQLSVMTRATPGTQVHQLVETVYFADATEAEKIAARERLDLIHERRKRRLPHERHQMRMRAFYVDLLEDGTWSRPSDLPADDCYFAVWDAYSDYLPARDRIGEPLVHEDQLLLSALDALPGGAPEFPPFIDMRSMSFSTTPVSRRTTGQHPDPSAGPLRATHFCEAQQWYRVRHVGIRSGFRNGVFHHETGSPAFVRAHQWYCDYRFGSVGSSVLVLG